MDIKEFNDRYGFSFRDCLFIRKLREAGFNNEQINAILETMDNICKGCYDAEDGCQCQNDE